MKLSEMNGEQLATCLSIITEPAERIIEDDEIIEKIKACMDVNEKGQQYVDIPRAILRMIPLLLGKHRRDTFTILGAMYGRTADEVAKQNGLQMVADIKAVFDRDLLDFFGSSGSAG